MPQERMFPAPEGELQPLADELAQWLQAREFDVQVMPVEGDAWLVQARQERGWKAAIGMGLATNIVLTRLGPSLKVEVGQGKWMDKAVAGAVGLLLLWPALIPAAIGAWQQSKLPQEVFDQVASYVARRGVGVASPWQQASAAPPPSAAETAPCPACGQPIKVGAKFCEHCGQAVPPEPPAENKRLCAQCGAELTATSKFCAECGAAAQG